MTYRFSVMITKEDDRYVAGCPELGVTPQGKDLEGARANPREAIELYLETGACPRQPDAHALCDSLPTVWPRAPARTPLRCRKRPLNS